MSLILSLLSIALIPFIFTFIIGYGIYKKKPVYDLFIEGAKSGISTAFQIMPFIITIFISIQTIISSGAIEFIKNICEPLLSFLHIPTELLPLILLRPISGSGSLILVQSLISDYGADSFIGRSASVMAGSCETVFYVLALYYGVTAAKHLRHALIVGIVGYIAGVIASVAICNFI